VFSPVDGTVAKTVQVGSTLYDAENFGSRPKVWTRYRTHTQINFRIGRIDRAAFYPVYAYD